MEIERAKIGPIRRIMNCWMHHHSGHSLKSLKWI